VHIVYSELHLQIATNSFLLINNQILNHTNFNSMYPFKDTILDGKGNYILP